MTEMLWHFDRFGLRAVYGSDSPRIVTNLMILLTLSGGFWRDLIVVPLVVFRRTRGVGLALGVVLILAALATTLLKYGVGRRRPPFVLSDVHALWGPSTSPSFPSGHTTASFAMASFLLFVLSQRAPSPLAFVGGTLLLSWATGVAVSRVYLGVHFPSDVIGAALIGACIGAASAQVYLRVPFVQKDAVSGRASEKAEPSAFPDGTRAGDRDRASS